MTRGWQTQGRSSRDRRRKKRQRAARPLSESMKPVAAAASTAAERDQRAPRQTASSGWRQPSSRTSTTLTIRPEEYGYVYSDLRRIAVLSAGIFAVLIALSFFIN